ncbi:MAG TPA: MerR family DNA-binding protein [Thermoanaerobaculia bacterium]|nr:MerR family DNA-binding protein [Thermoanaerobaculia bacterium]
MSSFVPGRPVERMALIGFAKALGFSLDEIRVLLDGFPRDTPAGARWSWLASKKLSELEAMSRRIETMRAALQLISRCGCGDLDRCAEAITASSEPLRGRVDERSIEVPNR